MFGFNDAGGLMITYPYKDFETFIEDKLAILSQCPTGKYLVDALRETDLSISPDSSLPRKTPMQTHENGISVSLGCLSSDSEGMVLDSLAHEISHVLMNKKDETFKIKYNPLDELYRNNLDEAKSVSLALQIGAELDELGVNKSMKAYQNGQGVEFTGEIIHYAYNNAVNDFNGAISENKNALKNGSAIKAGFLGRLQKDREKPNLSKVYDNDRLGIFAYIGKELSIKLGNNPQTVHSMQNYQKNYPFLKGPKALDKDDIKAYCDWCGKSIFSNQEMSVLLTPNSKKTGLSQGASSQLPIADLFMSQASSSFKMCEYRVVSIQQNISNSR